MALNTEQCKAFCAVAETGSFAQAAQASYVTPQSVSQQVKRLEREVGCSLFTRDNTGAAMTPAGREFYAWCRETLISTQEVIRRCRKLADADARQPIRLGISHDHTLSLYKHFVRTYMHNESSCDLEYVDLGSAEPIDLFVNALREERADIIEWIDPQEDGMDFLPLIRTRRCCLMSMGNPLSRKTTIEGADLVGQKVYVYSALWTKSLRLWLDEHGLGNVQLIEVGAPDAPALLKSYLNDKAIYLLPEQLSPLYESLLNVPLAIDVYTEYGLAYLAKNRERLAGLLACAEKAFSKAGRAANL